VKTRQEVKETELVRHFIVSRTKKEEETEGSEKGEINLNRRKRRQEA
jgi:hypothetical protein